MAKPTTPGIRFDIGDYAHQIELEFGHVLAQPPKGWYTKFTNKIVLEEGKKYTQIIGGVDVPVFHPKDIKANVYDADGQCVYVMPAAGVADFFDRPIQPSIGLRVVQQYVDYVMCRVLEWVKTAPTLAERFEHKKLMREDASGNRPELTGAQEDRLHQILRTLKGEIVHFIGDDVWHQVSAKVDSRHELMIEKGEDYRIAQWKNLDRKGLLRDLLNWGSDDNVSPNAR